MACRSQLQKHGQGSQAQAGAGHVMLRLPAANGSQSRRSRCGGRKHQVHKTLGAVTLQHLHLVLEAATASHSVTCDLRVEVLHCWRTCHVPAGMGSDWYGTVVRVLSSAEASWEQLLVQWDNAEDDAEPDHVNLWEVSLVDAADRRCALHSAQPLAAILAVMARNLVDPAGEARMGCWQERAGHWSRCWPRHPASKGIPISYRVSPFLICQSVLVVITAVPRTQLACSTLLAVSNIQSLVLCPHARPGL